MKHTAAEALRRGVQPRSRWVALLGVVLVATFAAVAWVQWRQFQLLDKSSRYSDDNIVWSFFQVEIEYLALRESLKLSVDSPASRDDEALHQRYEIFVSRINLIDPARINALLPTPVEHLQTWDSLTRFVAQADAVMDAPHPSTEGLATLEGALSSLRKPVHELSLMASLLVVEQGIRRNNAIRQQIHLGIGLTVLLSLTTLAFAAIVVRQWRASQRRSAQLEDLAANLRGARESADAANQAKSAFLTTMSHELRTPFNGLLGMLTLLDDTRLDADQAQLVHTAQDSAEHLLSILNDVLDVSQLESGKLEIQPAAVDLHRLLRDVQTVMSASALAKGLVLTASVDPRVPQWVMADARRIKQVLFNLMSNAIKFTERGGVTLVASVGTQPRDGLVLTVTDTGIGMDASTMTRLFQRFSQGDVSISRRYGGTGLGLEISRSLARMMGGDITVTSQPEVGSQFRAWLPLPACDAPAPRARHEPRSGLALRSHDILVVEDHATNRQYVGALLNRMGQRVRFATTGEEALVEAQRETPDLILMDVHMPGMDGLQATRALRAMAPPLGQVKIIALTADAISQTRELVLAAGMDDLLTKPFLWQDMAKLLSTHLADASDAPDAGRPVMAQPTEAAAAHPMRPPAAPNAPTDTTDDPAQHLALASIQAMQDLLTPAVYKSLLAEFFGSTQLLDALHTALLQGDGAASFRWAHHLKGAAQILGLSGLADSARGLEGLAREGAPMDGAALAADTRRVWLHSQALCRSQGLIP